MLDVFGSWADLIDFGPYFDYEGHKARQRAARRINVGMTPWTLTQALVNSTPASSAASQAVIDDTGLTVTVELPGVRPADVKVETEGTTLIVSWKKAKKDGSLRWSLTSDLDLTTIAANIDLGVLTVKVKKLATPASTRRTIEITKTDG